MKRKIAVFSLLACGLASSVWLAWPQWHKPQEKTGFSRAPGIVALPYSMPGGGELTARKLRVRFTFLLPSKDTATALFQSAPKGGLRLIAADSKLLLEAGHREPFRNGRQLVAGPFDIPAGVPHRAELFYEGDNLRLVLDDKTFAVTTYAYFDIKLTSPAFGIAQAAPPPEISNVEVVYSAVPVSSRTRPLSAAVFSLALLSLAGASFLFLKGRKHA